MVIRKIAELLEAEVILGEDKLDMEVDMAFSSDMMSDVLAYVTGRTVLLTGLVNEHVIRTAEMVDLECIVFVRGKKPTQDIIDKAEESGMVLLRVIGASLILETVMDGLYTWKFHKWIDDLHRRFH